MDQLIEKSVLNFKLRLVYIALNALDENDVKVNCPLCSYFEIWSNEADKIFFYCKNEDCRKWTWFVCKANFNYPRDICNLTEEEREYINSGNGLQKHIKWIESMSSVEEITKIWEQQSMRYCPKWGTGGRKDEKWTHIACKKCKNMFCYFWGLSSDQADKSNSNGDIFKHNDTSLK